MRNMELGTWNENKEQELHKFNAVNRIIKRKFEKRELKQTHIMRLHNTTATQTLNFDNEPWKQLEQLRI